MMKESRGFLVCYIPMRMSGAPRVLFFDDAESVFEASAVLFSDEVKRISGVTNSSMRL